MNFRDFGKTGIKVSEVGFGAWAIGGNEHGISYGPTEDKQSLAAIEEALAADCNFFDTADVYGWGHSEELIGRALKGKRDRAVIATKVGSDFYQGYGYQSFTADYFRFALEKSLRRLKTDFIDVYQLHNPPAELLAHDSDTFDALRRLKKEGKVRAWGVSVTSLDEGLVALASIKPDSIQVPFNIFSAEAARELMPIAADQGCAVIAREPLANGFLSGKYGINASFPSGDIRHNWPRDYINARATAAAKLDFLEAGRTMAQAAILWALSEEQLAVVIPGVKSPEQARENFRVYSAKPLSDEEMAQIEQLQSTDFGL